MSQTSSECTPRTPRRDVEAKHRSRPRCHEDEALQRIAIDPLRVDVDHAYAYHQVLRCTRKYCTYPWRSIEPLVTKSLSRESLPMGESRLAKSSTTNMQGYYPAAAGYPLPVRCACAPEAPFTYEPIISEPDNGKQEKAMEVPCALDGQDCPTGDSRCNMLK